MLQSNAEDTQPHLLGCLLLPPHPLVPEQRWKAQVVLFVGVQQEQGAC